MMDDFFVRNKLVRDCVTQQTLLTLALYVRYRNHIEGLEHLNQKTSSSKPDPQTAQQRLDRLEERYSDGSSLKKQQHQDLVVGIVGSGIIGRVFIEFLSGKTLYGK